jgi:hypothetical protein
MPAIERRLDPAIVAARLRSEAERIGVFEAVVGLNTATTTIKSVHLMNDLAQQVLGGAPGHRGDFLCSVIRYEKAGGADDAGEDNSDAALRADERFGADYKQAFPPALGATRTRAIREAAHVLLNADGGMYRAGDNMASGLATHWTLLGFDGFSRFGLGGALARVLGEQGRERVKELFQEANDPVSRALRPLMLGGDLVRRVSGREEVHLTAFDERFGARVSNLLRHPLSKPTKLRALALAGVAWAVLRVLGAGRTGGRPVLLAIPAQWQALGGRLRRPAVQSLYLGVSRLDAAVADALSKDEVFLEALTEADYAGDDALILRGAAPAGEALAALRDARTAPGATRVYWPDAFAAALGRRAGCVGPTSDRAGWGRYFCLTPDLLEAVILMFVDPEGSPRQWRSAWADVLADLGLVIGANPSGDERYLRDGGLSHVSLDDLERNAEHFLGQACRRGLARHMPDGEAEVGVQIY